MKRFLLPGVLCALLVGAGLAGTAPAAPHQNGTIVADLGFKPKPNGFAFENYGQSNDDLNPQTMQTLFGPAVCASGTGAACVLHPQARAWMEENNKSMQGGHCFGFSVASLAFFDSKRAQPQQFGGTTAFVLPQTPKIANFIAYAWVFQALDRINEARVMGAPNQIVAALAKSFKSPGELYTIAFFKRDGSGGHAVTPFAIEQRPDGTDAILIYDNNFPGDTRRILVDRAANTWRYQASTNPNEPSELYEGDAQSQSLMLYPTFPGFGVQPCPFCGAAATEERRAAGAAAKKRYDSYFLAGDPRNQPRLLLTDAKGRKLGYVGKRFVNRIPGARVIRPLLGVAAWRLNQQPEYRVPAGRKVTITIDGTKLKKPTTAGLSIVLRGRFIGISRLTLKPGQRSTVRRNANGSSFSYTSGKTQVGKPLFTFGFQGLVKDRAFTIDTHGLKGNSTLAFTVDEKDGTVKVDASDDEDELVYDLEMETIDEDGSETFTEDDLSLTEDESGTLDYEEWTDDDSEPPIDIEEDTGD